MRVSFCLFFFLRQNLVEHTFGKKGTTHARKRCTQKNYIKFSIIALNNSLYNFSASYSLLTSLHNCITDIYQYE